MGEIVKDLRRLYPAGKAGVSAKIRSSVDSLVVISNDTSHAQFLLEFVFKDVRTLHIISNTKARPSGKLRKGDDQ